MNVEINNYSNERENKKIVFVTSSIVAGGSQRVLVQLANYLVNQSYECHIITVYENTVFYHIDEKIKIIQIKAHNKFNSIDKVFRYRVLRKIVKSINPDIVLTLPEEIGIYVILSLIGTSIPIIVSERNDPKIMPHKKITRILRKIVYPFAKGLVFQTQQAKSFFSNKLQKKSIIIPNPINKSRIPLKYEGIRVKKIVAAGRLEKQKNFSVLIDAFYEFSKECNDYKLYIYGEGKLRNILEKKIDDLEMNNKIILAGRKKNLLEEISNSSMFVLSSNYEGMPNVLIEAMCMGLPVISTDCPSGGPSELITNGENGILVPVNDAEALKEAMKKLTNDELANKFGNEAYKKRKELLSSEIFRTWENYLFKNSSNK